MKQKNVWKSRPRLLVACVIGVALLCIAGAFLSSRAQAAAGIYKTVNFQGKVVNSNGTNVTDGLYTFRFRIYTSPSGGGASSCTSACVWEETKSIATTDGIFQTNLGDTNSLPGSVDFNSDSLYLSVLFNGDTEMTPRVRLAAVPYAFNADKLGGLDASTFVQLSPSVAQTGSINVNGNIKSGGTLQGNILDAASSGALSIGSTNTTSINLNQSTALAPNKNFTFGSGTGNFDQSTSTGIFSTGTGAVGLNGSITIATGKDLTFAGGASVFDQSASSGMFKTGTGFVMLNGRVSIATSKNLIFTGGVSNFDQSASTGTFDTGTGAVGFNGVISVASGKSMTFLGGAADFDQSASSGVFKTGTGSVTLNGDVTVAATKTLTVTSGSTVLTGNTTGIALTVSNSTSIGDIFNAKDNTAFVFGIQDGGNVYLHNSVDSAGALKVFNVANSSVLGVNTVAGTVVLGNTSGGIPGLNGQLVFANATNANTVSILTGVTSSSYTLTLPTALGSSGSCLKDTTGAGVLGFGSCGTGGSGTLQDAYDNSTSPATITETASKGIVFTSSTNVPTVDQFTVDNTSSTGVATTGVNGIAIKYKGGAAAVEAAAERIDLTPGTTSGGTWSGLRIAAGATGPVSGVTEYGIKVEGPSSPGSGTETGMYIGSGWDTGLDVQSGGLNLAALTSDPSSAASNNMRVYAKEVSGRIVPKWIGPAGLSTPFQAALWSNNIVLWTPGATTGTWQGTLGGNVGTAASVNPTTTNLYTTIRRSTFTSAATANVQLGTRSDPQFYRGGTSGQGGFFFFARFGTSTWTAGDRLFVGMTDATATAVTTGNPSALTANSITGFGIDATDTAITFMHNDAATSVTKDTISGQPTLAANQGYDAYIYAKPNDSTIYYRLDNLNTGAVIVNTSITTDMPVNTSMMAAHTEMSNGANTTLGAAVLGVNRIYIETDR